MAPHSGERRPPAWQDRSVLLRSSALAAGLALALVGCGAVMPGANVDVQAVASQDGPGVSDDSVKVVFVAVDLDAVQKLTGFKTAVGRRPGGARSRPSRTWVNANGGIGGPRAGRRLPALRRRQNDSPGRGGAALQPDHPGRQGVRRRPDRAVPDQRPSLLRPAPDARARRHPDRHTTSSTTTSCTPTCGRPATPSTTRSSTGIRRRAGRAGVLRGSATGSAWSPPTRGQPARASTTSSYPPWRSSASRPRPGLDRHAPTPATLFTGLTQAAIDLPQGKGIDRVMFLGGARMASLFASVSADARASRPATRSRASTTRRFFVNNPDHDPRGRHRRHGRPRASTPAQDVADVQCPSRRPSRDGRAWTSTPTAGIASTTPRERRASRCPTATPPGCSSSARDDLTATSTPPRWAQAVGTAGAEFMHRVRLRGARSARTATPPPAATA